MSPSQQKIIDALETCGNILHGRTGEMVQEALSIAREMFGDNSVLGIRIISSEAIQKGTAEFRDHRGVVIGIITGLDTQEISDVVLPCKDKQ